MAPVTGGIGGAWTSRVYAEASLSCVVCGRFGGAACTCRAPSRAASHRPPVRGAGGESECGVGSAGQGHPHRDPDRYLRMLKHSRLIKH